MDKPQTVGYRYLQWAQWELQLWEWTSRICLVEDYYCMASISWGFPVWSTALCGPKCAPRAADLGLIPQCIWKLRPDLATAAGAVPWVVDTFEFVDVRYDNIKELLLPIKMHGFSAGSYASKKKKKDQAQRTWRLVTVPWRVPISECFNVRISAISMSVLENLAPTAKQVSRQKESLHFTRIRHKDNTLGLNNNYNLSRVAHL